MTDTLLTDSINAIKTKVASSAPAASAEDLAYLAAAVEKVSASTLANDAITEINTLASGATSAIQSAGTTATSAIQSAGDTATTAIQSAGTTATSAIQSAGTTATSAIQNALAGIPFSMIKSIQRGNATGNFSGSSNLSISITAVNVNKTVVLLQGGIYGASTPQALFLSDLTATSFTVSTSHQNGGYMFSWQVVEFI